MEGVEEGEKRVYFEANSEGQKEGEREGEGKMEGGAGSRTQTQMPHLHCRRG